MTKRDFQAAEYANESATAAGQLPGKATITFYDDGDDVKCKLVFDPPIDFKNEIATPAQQVALSRFHEMLKEADYESINDDGEG